MWGYSKHFNSQFKVCLVVTQSNVNFLLIFIEFERSTEIKTKFEWKKAKGYSSTGKLINYKLANYSYNDQFC